MHIKIKTVVLLAFLAFYWSDCFSQTKAKYKIIEMYIKAIDAKVEPGVSEEAYWIKWAESASENVDKGFLSFDLNKKKFEINSKFIVKEEFKIINIDSTISISDKDSCFLKFESGKEESIPVKVIFYRPLNPKIKFENKYDYVLLVFNDRLHKLVLERGN